MSGTPGPEGGARLPSRVPRVMIAGAGSGSGKTTVACGLLAAARRRGMRAVGFKAGPDYIDPEYLRLAGRCPVHNLDSWMTDGDSMASLFFYASREADVAIVEGVMGLYDGESLDAPGGKISSAGIAAALGLPVILMINARSVGESAAAVALGFREYCRDVDLRGVILNGTGSDSHRDMIASALERVGVPLLGALRRDERLSVPERHLGLLPAREADGMSERVELIREAVESQVDVDAVFGAARSAAPFTAPPPPEFDFAARVRVAVAMDDAFSFYYPESLTALEKSGAELVFFSPLRDPAPPDRISGMLLGGGFPEMFAAELEANVSMRRGVAEAAARGLPVLAECGGMMYLCRSLTDMSGRSYGMAGVIPASCVMRDKLQAVGYVEAAALRDTILCPEGGVLRGHEFHFSAMEPDEPDVFPYAFSFRRRRGGEPYPGGYAAGNVLSSYLHLNMFGSRAAAGSFLLRCAGYDRIQ